MSSKRVRNRAAETNRPPAQGSTPKPDISRSARVPESTASLPTDPGVSVPISENKQSGKAAVSTVTQTKEGPSQPKKGPEHAQTKDSMENFLSLLKRLRKQTDDILLQRTRVRKELKTCEESRDHLRSSTDALFAVVQSQATKDISSKPTTLSSRRFDSGTATMNPSESVIASIGTPGDFGSCYEQYVKDYNTLRGQEDTAKDEMDELSSLEFEGDKLHSTIANLMKSPNFLEALRSEILVGDIGTPEPESHPPAIRESPPPLVSEYFDKQGDVKIYRDRLEEAEDAYREGRIEREFLKDRGDIIEVSDEKFESTYVARQQEIQRNIEIAKESAWLLAKRCLEAGYDINAYRFKRPPVLQSNPPAYLHSEDDTGIFVPQTRPLEAQQTITSTEQQTPSSRVEIWRHDVSRGSPERLSRS